MTRPRPDPADWAEAISFSGPFVELFARFQADADARADAAGRLDRAAFAKLPAVQRALAELETTVAPTPDVLNEYLAMLHAGFAYWRAGSRVLPVERSAIEPALGTAPLGAPAVPFGACYLYFPDRWLWLQIGEDQPHEPLHGIFVSGPSGNPLDGDEITLLAAGGVRGERDGFSQVSLAASPAEFAVAHTMVRRPPFAPLMAGGAAAGLKSIGSQAELLHLAHVALVYAARYVTGPHG
jgi:hypothetical protein